MHVHARDQDKQPTGDVNMFKEIIVRIRDKCDMLIQTTNGIGSKKDPVTGKIGGLGVRLRKPLRSKPKQPK